MENQTLPAVCRQANWAVLGIWAGCVFRSTDGSVSKQNHLPKGDVTDRWEGGSSKSRS